ncbi:hypothetical protein CFOL_v3_03221 [Cephalotus follicularis]|uniref:Uncharacterized protein n=1 Tax=Cephalotus follicularis TaxID=3775 RepID=A0A1Q3AVH8_CEPFO|nr:hypothetical protein CFOL_v3_03221 [Cephalotus follicularis]
MISVSGTHPFSPITSKYIWVDELIGLRFSSTKHVTIQCESRSEMRLRGIRSEHGSVKEDIGRAKMVEDEASVVEVVEFESAEANEFKSVELSVGVPDSNEKGLELLEVDKLVCIVMAMGHIGTDFVIPVFSLLKSGTGTRGVSSPMTGRTEGEARSRRFLSTSSSS